MVGKDQLSNGKVNSATYKHNLASSNHFTVWLFGTGLEALAELSTSRFTANSRKRPPATTSRGLWYSILTSMNLSGERCSY